MTEELQQLFIQAFPALDELGQQQAKQLYWLLAKGKAVTIEQLANAIQLPTSETSSLLDNWTGVTFNDENEINGFWGVSTSPTTHSFQLNDITLYTWCAWDLLFMPHLFNQTVHAETKCPITKQKISLVISENAVVSSSPKNAAITFIKPDLDALKANVTNSFCQYIFFVESEETGKEWQKNNSNGFLMTLDQGYDLGKKIIKDVFKDQT